MKSIYIVGAQCTGKTTLTEALAIRLRSENPGIRLEVISEMARSVLEKHNFTRDDVREGMERCFMLQKLILESQSRRESSLDPGAVLLSDRSGMDPLIYSSFFAKNQVNAQKLSERVEWQGLKARMMHAVVFVCEPVEEWLHDDGIRLMPQSLEEWMALHASFCQMLREHGISFGVLPASLRSLTDRVDVVLKSVRA